MMFRIFISAVAVVAFTIQSNAQVHRCGTVEVSRARDAQHPGFLEAVAKTFDQAKLKLGRAAAAPPVYQIPVVVHVVYNTPQENLPWK